MRCWLDIVLLWLFELLCFPIIEHKALSTAHRLMGGQNVIQQAKQKSKHFTPSLHLSYPYFCLLNHCCFYFTSFRIFLLFFCRFCFVIFVLLLHYTAAAFFTQQNDSQSSMLPLTDVETFWSVNRCVCHTFLSTVVECLTNIFISHKPFYIVFCCTLNSQYN